MSHRPAFVEVVDPAHLTLTRNDPTISKFKEECKELLAYNGSRESYARMHMSSFFVGEYYFYDSLLCTY